MNTGYSRKIILALSLFLAALMIVAGCAGLFIPGIYSRETANWQAQSMGQDIVDLFLVTPVLLVTSLQAYKKNKKALLLWAGVLFYLIYTFSIYCFAVHFNQLFIVYCFILGLSSYLFLWFILSQYNEPVTAWFNEMLPARVIGIYLIVIAGIFYLLWLSQIIPANIRNTAPKELAETGLFTNPVQVLDLSVYLPALIITGILLLHKHPMGLLLTAPLLLFCMLTDITIASLIVVMKLKEIESNLLLPVIMSLMALVSWVLLTIYLRSMKREG
jgi:hypothetical protein